MVVDDRAPDTSRALALRVLRERAGDSIVQETDLASARPAAMRRREALASIEALARVVLGRVDTSPALRREVLRDASSVALAERARLLALHGLYDDAALLLAADDTETGSVTAWRARAARRRVEPATDTPTMSHEVTMQDAVRGVPDVSRPDAVSMPAPTPPGTASFALDASLGIDTEAADHAAALFHALVAFLHTHPAPERAAWIRSIALHPAVASSEDGELEAALMGRPASPASRAWLAVHLAEATSVTHETQVSPTDGTLWVTVGAERRTLRRGDPPTRGEPPPATAIRLETSYIVDVLAVVPSLEREVATCIAAGATHAGAPEGVTRGSAWNVPHPRSMSRTDAAVAAARATRGRLLAALATRWPEAPGLGRLAASAVAARCVTHGPWPERGETP